MGQTLLILAAGMGSRYGGLKQIDPVGPSGELILDYSVFDAITAGFDRIAFVIRQEFEREFRDAVVSRYEDIIPVDIVFQEIDDLPTGLTVPVDREKPWGTGHAIWSARHVVNQPFLAINADDFYGQRAFSIMADFLRGEASTETIRIGMVAYPILNTLSKHGSVSRGICTLKPSGRLVGVAEYSEIAHALGGLQGLDSKNSLCQFTGTEMVSMNFWGFLPKIFARLEELFRNFLVDGGLENQKAEFYIPSAVSALIASETAEVTVLTSPDRWLGVTYREDREAVALALSQLTSKGHYPTPLWKNRL